MADVRHTPCVRQAVFRGLGRKEKPMWAELQSSLGAAFFPRTFRVSSLADHLCDLYEFSSSKPIGVQK